MSDKVKVIITDGSEITLAEWQKIYELEVGSPMIGRHFSLNEARFVNDISAYGELIVSQLLMTVLDAFREAVNQPITINSFNRNEEHQAELKKRGFKTATNSPHVVKLAADIDTKSDEQTFEWVKVLQRVSHDTGIKIRIGYRQYMALKQTFIHVDVCPEYFAKGKPYHNQPHPGAWDNVITW